MIEVKKEGIILKSRDIDFENDGVLNPAVIKDGGAIHFFYRAVHIHNQSCIGYCRLSAPLTIAAQMNVPILIPEFDYEKQGVEDPRIVKIDGVYYLTYIAFDGVDALGALATSTDLVHFKKQGIIVPKITRQDFERLTKNNPALYKKYVDYIVDTAYVMDKDVMFFPRRINGKLTFLHRIKPDIQLVAVNELSELNDDFWEAYFLNFKDNILLDPRYPHEIDYVGGGCPPIETEHGWLLIYHGVKKSDVKGFEYSCCAALLELDNPHKEIARLPYPLFKPELDYELEGDVDNVCFPTGTVTEGDTLYIYYGAADDLIACASVSLSGLVADLLANK